MKKYPKYKETEIEWQSKIPAHWDILPVKFVAEVNPNRKRNLDPNSFVGYAPMERIRYDNMNPIEIQVSNLSSGLTYCEEGDIVMAKVTPCFENGNIAIVPKVKQGCCYGSSELLVYRAQENVLTRFLFYSFLNKGFVDAGVSTMRGTGGLKRVTTEFAQNAPIALPSLTEQQKIVEFLDYKTSKIDELTSSLSERIEDLKKYRQSVISETVTRGLDKNAKLKDSGIEWIGMIPEHWEATRFKFMAEVKSNLVHPADYSQYPQVSPDSIEKDTGHLLRWKTVEESGVISDNHLFYKGQIVYSKIRPNLNKVIIAPFDGLCSADMYPIETRQNTKFLLWQMLSSAFASQVNSVIMSRVKMPKINAEELGEIVVALPPLSEQQAIADYLDRKTKQIDEAIAATEQRIADLQSYRSSLITEAVTGQIDVREWSAPAL